MSLFWMSLWLLTRRAVELAWRVLRSLGSLCEAELLMIPWAWYSLRLGVLRWVLRAVRAAAARL